jgi:hypothetical protein
MDAAVGAAVIDFWPWVVGEAVDTDQIALQHSQHGVSRWQCHSDPALFRDQAQLLSLFYAAHLRVLAAAVFDVLPTEYCCLSLAWIDGFLPTCTVQQPILTHFGVFAVVQCKACSNLPSLTFACLLLCSSKHAAICSHSLWRVCCCEVHSL